jgi:hypothetical protein
MANVTQESVSAALDVAVDQNGYVELINDPSEEVATDLADRDVDFEGVETDVLVPFVRAWQESRRS